MRKNYTKSTVREKGSSLIAVVIITMVSITVIGAMVLIVSLVLMSSISWQKSADALFAAESYTEDFLLRIVRDPSTVPLEGENFVINGATVNAKLYEAPDGRPNVLFVVGTSGKYSRKIRLVYTVESGSINVILREEVEN